MSDKLANLQNRMADNFAEKYQEAFSNAIKKQSKNGVVTQQDIYAFQMDMLAMNNASQMSSQANNVNHGVSKAIINAIN